MMRGIVFGWHRFGGLITELPVLFELDSTMLEGEFVGRGKFVDAFINLKRRRHVIK